MSGVAVKFKFLKRKAFRITNTKPLSQLTLIALSILVTGCMMVRGNTVQVPSQWPPERSGEMKSIGISITGHFPPFRAENSKNRTEEEGIKRFTRLMKKVYMESALFTEIRPYKATADLHAHIELTRETTRPELWRTLHNCTVGLIPSYSNTTVTMVSVFQNQSGVEIGIAKSESYTWWYHLFLVVMLPFGDSSNNVMENIYDDLNRATLDEARAKGFL